MDLPRIGVIINDLDPGGAQLQSYYVARALHESGVDFQVYYTKWSERFTDLQAWGIDTMNYGRYRSIARRVVDLTRLVRAYRPELLVSMRTYANLYAGVTGRLLGIRSLGSLQTTLSNEIANSGRCATRAMCTINTAIAPNSYAARDQLLEVGWSRPARVFMLRNVIDLDEFDRAEVPNPAPPKERKIFFVGRLVREKNLDHLFDALARAHQIEPTVHLVIVGDGSYRQQAEERVVSLRLGGAVTFLGVQNNVVQLLKTQANMLVLTSTEEGLPNVVIEAMAAGLPVITTPAGDAGAVVEHERTGIVVDFDDLDGLAGALVRLWRDPDLCRRMGLAGRRKAEMEFSYSTLHDKVLTLCQRVLAL